MKITTPGRFLYAMLTALLMHALLVSAAQARTVRQYTIEQFMDNADVFGPCFAADGRSLLYTGNQSGIFNVYRVPLAGGQPVQVTHSTKDSTFLVSCMPSNAGFLYARDEGGNELTHIYLMTADGSERDLTPGSGMKAMGIEWSYDRKSFFYQTNARDHRYFDVYEMPVDSLQPRLVFKNDVGYEFQCVSPDKRWLAFRRPGASTADADVFLYNVASGEMKNITRHTGEVSSSPQTFDPQSKTLYYLTDKDEEFKYLVSYDLATGRTSMVEHASWDVTGAFFSHLGRYRATAINQDGRTRWKIRDLVNRQEVALPPLPGGDIFSLKISDDEKRMAFTFNGDRSPTDIYVYDLDTHKTTRLTHTLNPQIEAADLVDARVVRYPSFDGLKIPALLYVPQKTDAAHPAPAVLWIHGGPGGQSRLGYSALLQYLVNHGYIVLAVNNRGSSGYGKTFFTADDGKHGREPLWDCVEAKTYLQTLPYVDRNRIGIMGASYGGYMVLAALAFKPQVFTVGVDLFGPSNWIRTLQSIPPYWESERLALYKEIGDPVADAQKLRDTSPLFHADQIVKPLMVLQGANDPRVIKPESDEIVDNIRKRKGVVEYVVFEGEGHGFTKKADEIRAYESILEFLDRYLKQ